MLIVSRGCLTHVSCDAAAGLMTAKGKRLQVPLASTADWSLLLDRKGAEKKLKSMPSPPNGATVHKEHLSADANTRIFCVVASVNAGTAFWQLRVQVHSIL